MLLLLLLVLDREKPQAVQFEIAIVRTCSSASPVRCPFRENVPSKAYLKLKEIPYLKVCCMVSLCVVASLRILGLSWLEV